MKYIIADPTKNITVLVIEPVDKKNYAAVAKEMFAAVPACEQVGFFVEPNHLEMAAGEFCGNATLSAAAYYAYKHGISEGTVNMTCSGVDGEIPVRLTKCNTQTGFHVSFSGTLTMPYPQRTETLDSHPVVYLPGIAHMIMPADRFTKRQVENNIREYADRAAQAAKMAPEDLQAFGILLWDETASYMRPCVYCRDIDTVIWESGCATGSTAVGFYRAKERNCGTITEVNQPGGTITIDCDPAERKLNLTGNVTLCIDT